MRKLVYAINLSLDGCCDHTKLSVPDEEASEYSTQLVRDADLLIYGRKTYQLMVPYWPDVAKNHSKTKVANAFADAFDATSKVVVSKTLGSADERNTTVVCTDLQDEILRLKQEPGKYMMTGGVSLPSQLIELGLVDEYHLFVQPIIVGEGRRLLEGIKLQEKLQLKLVESKTFKSCVALHYVKQ